MHKKFFYKDFFIDGEKENEILSLQNDYRKELNSAFEKLNALQQQIAERKIADLENSLSELEADLNTIIEEASVSH